MRLLTIALLPLIGIPNAYAQTRCDCTVDGWTGDCRANVAHEGSFIRITTSTTQCSRVDWYGNNEPFVTIVTEGEDIEEWLGASAPSVAVQSCKVCTDGAILQRSMPPDTNDAFVQVQPDWYRGRLPDKRPMPATLDGLLGEWVCDDISNLRFTSSGGSYVLAVEFDTRRNDHELSSLSFAGTTLTTKDVSTGADRVYRLDPLDGGGYSLTLVSSSGFLTSSATNTWYSCK